MIRSLKEKFPIERARMGVRVTLPGKEGKAAKAQVVELFEAVDSDEWSGEAAEIVRLGEGVVCHLQIVSVNNGSFECYLQWPNVTIHCSS